MSLVASGDVTTGAITLRTARPSAAAPPAAPLRPSP
jgi:hypothetical protein